MRVEWKDKPDEGCGWYYFRITPSAEIEIVSVTRDGFLIRMYYPGCYKPEEFEGSLYAKVPMPMQVL
jgi:hypothetical protein